MDNETQIKFILDAYPQLDRLMAQTLLKLNEDGRLKKYCENRDWTSTQKEEGGVLHTLCVEKKYE